MFNISENTKIMGRENAPKISHLQHMLHSGKITKINYTYYGKFVQRGTLFVETKYGLLKVKFYMEHGWFREMEIEKV